MKKCKTVVVLPAYKAAATLEKTINDIPFEWVDELIFVDDASPDETVIVAKKFAEKHQNFYLKTPGDRTRSIDGRKPITIFRHEKNLGYGGNQKTCYRLALLHDADIVVMLHPDYQYDPKLVKYFVEFIRDGYFDVMLGSRVRSRREALQGGMPLYKYIANRALTTFENIVSGRNLSEWHTGMRAYRREVLEKVGYAGFSDDFVFDTQMLFAIVENEFTIGDIPVPVRYFKEASSINFRRSVRYGLTTVWESIKFIGRKMKRKV